MSTNSDNNESRLQPSLHCSFFRHQNGVTSLLNWPNVNSTLYKTETFWILTASCRVQQYLITNSKHHATWAGGKGEKCLILACNTGHTKSDKTVMNWQYKICWQKESCICEPLIGLCTLIYSKRSSRCSNLLQDGIHVILWYAYKLTAINSSAYCAMLHQTTCHRWYTETENNSCTTFGCPSLTTMVSAVIPYQ